MMRIPTHYHLIYLGEMLLEEFLKPLAISQSRLANTADRRFLPTGQRIDPWQARHDA